MTDKILQVEESIETIEDSVTIYPIRCSGKSHQELRSNSGWKDILGSIELSDSISDEDKDLALGGYLCQACT